jgi:uncharacterized protein involved in oxidation of intracellular sulfur
MADKKIMLVATHGEENPEKATIPFVLSTAALSSEIDATVVLQSSSVWLVFKGYSEHIHAEGFPPLKELIYLHLELGGNIYVCGPCIKSRKIQPEELISGVKVVNAGTLVAESVDMDTVFNY